MQASIYTVVDTASQRAGDRLTGIEIAERAATYNATRLQRNAADRAGEEAAGGGGSSSSNQSLGHADAGESGGSSTAGGSNKGLWPDEELGDGGGDAGVDGGDTFSAGDEAVPMYADREVYSGPEWPLPEEMRETKLLFDNVDLRGGDLAEIEHVDSAPSCRRACADFAAEAPSRCVAWTLSKTQQVCFLKTGNYTRVRQNKTAALISGILAS